MTVMSEVHLLHIVDKPSSHGIGFFSTQCSVSDFVKGQRGSDCETKKKNIYRVLFVSCVALIFAL